MGRMMLFFHVTADDDEGDSGPPLGFAVRTNGGWRWAVLAGKGHANESQELYNGSDSALTALATELVKRGILTADQLK